MSIGGSLSGVSFAGLGSGIDTQSIIAQLMQIESIPLTRLRARKAGIQARNQLYDGLRERVDALRTATSGLEAASVYTSVRAASSDESVATVTAQSGAAVGSFELAVRQLAKGEKLMSTPFASASSELGLSGSFLVNGKLVSVEATDSLQAVAGKINAAKGGVAATVVNGGAGQVYLSVSGSRTGASARISLAGVSGGALAGLGLVSSSLEAREAVSSDTVRSLGLSSKTAALGTLMGASTAGTIAIGGTDVTVDLAADSLETVAAKINAAGTGATASVVEVEQGSEKVFKLQVQGAGVPAGLSDPDGIWQQLGVLQGAAVDRRQSAENALFSVEGLDQSRESNQVSGIIEGVTFQLLSADSATPKKTTVTVSRDTGAVVESVKKYRDAYNALATYIAQNSAFDKDTFESGPLFGDGIARQVQATVFDAFSIAAQGVGLGNLGVLGFSVEPDGSLTLDEAALTALVESDPDAVRRTMAVEGSATGAGLLFLGATARSKTLASGFVVDITQPATTSNVVSNLASGVWEEGETLTFSGDLFGTSVEVTLSAGQDLASVVSQINNDSRLQGRVTASIEAGKLRLDGSRYGTPGRFSVVSNLEPKTTNSGIGAGGVVTDGLDVAGTINGEEAEGRGQVLSGKKGNLTTEGVQAMYVGSSTGNVGTLSFSVGWAPRAIDRLLALTDSANGLMAAAEDALESQEADADAGIEDLEERLAIREQTLRRKFLAMEQAMAAMQQQLARLQQVQQ